MGFFDRLGKGIGRGFSGVTGKLLVISHDFRPGELAWVYPSDTIPYGSRIVVGPNQAAIIVRSGKILGVLRQGEWVLDTAHVPGLRGLMEGLYEGTPLPIRVIFVNVTEKDLRFGGQGNTKDGVPVKYHGMIHVAVPDNDEDIKRFALRIVAEDKVFTSEELEERLRVYINDIVESYLGGTFSIQVQAAKHVIRQGIQAEIARLVRENWYLDVKAVGIDVDIPEEWLQRLNEQGWMQILAVASTNPQLAQLMQSYDLQRRLMDALREARGGNVAGLAILLPLLQQFTQQLQQLGQQAGATTASTAGGAAARQGPAVPRRQQGQVDSQGYVARCPYCGAEIPSQLAAARPRFCPFCGKPLKWCPNGHVAPAEAKYCPVCGAPLEG